MPFRMNKATALAAALLLTALSTTPALAWSSEQWPVDWPNADAGEGSITVDKFGAKHILYKRDCEIYYRTNRSGSWIVTKLRATSSWVYCNTLKDAFVTREGAVYVVYTRETFDEVLTTKFGTNASGAWVYRDAVAPADQPYVAHAAIAVQGGIPRVAYSTIDRYGDRPPSLMHRTYRADGSVGITRLSSETATHVDIAIDGGGKIHVTFEVGRENTGSAIKYVTNRTGSWVTRMISESGDSDNGATDQMLALDPNGFVHVAWRRCNPCGEQVGASVVYATNLSGSWVRKTVFSGRLITPILAYSNGVHLVWHEKGPNLEEVLHYAGNVGGTWQHKIMTFPGPLAGNDAWVTEAEALSIAARLGHPYILFISSRDQRDPTINLMGIKSN